MMVGTFEKPAKRVVLQSPVIVQPEVEVDLASQSEGEVVEEQDDDSFEDEDEEEEMEVAVSSIFTFVRQLLLIFASPFTDLSPFGLVSFPPFSVRSSPNSLLRPSSSLRLYSLHPLRLQATIFRPNPFLRSPPTFGQHPLHHQEDHRHLRR